MANIPGQSVDDGDTLFEHLFPLVLPEGDGDHRYLYIHARLLTRTLLNVFSTGFDRVHAKFRKFWWSKSLLFLGTHASSDMGKTHLQLDLSPNPNP